MGTESPAQHLQVPFAVVYVCVSMCAYAYTCVCMSVNMQHKGTLSVTRGPLL